MKKLKLKETPETKKLRAEMHKQGFKTWKISDRFNGGVLDILALRAGTTLYIEMKVEDNKLTALQKQTIKDIAEREGIPLCITARINKNGEREIEVERFDRSADKGFKAYYKSYSDLMELLTSYV